MTFIPIGIINYNPSVIAVFVADFTGELFRSNIHSVATIPSICTKYNANISIFLIAA